ncbi:hypothetical protein PQX77_018646 [Marasmius sp. AFHP31]|nr:hypothetical protein PQX77_018646 [Marasmius sp. AFHP31]
MPTLGSIQPPMPTPRRRVSIQPQPALNEVSVPTPQPPHSSEDPQLEDGYSSDLEVSELLGAGDDRADNGADVEQILQPATPRPGAPFRDNRVEQGRQRFSPYKRAAPTRDPEVVAGIAHHNVRTNNQAHRVQVFGGRVVNKDTLKRRQKIPTSDPFDTIRRHKISGQDRWTVWYALASPGPLIPPLPDTLVELEPMHLFLHVDTGLVEDFVHYEGDDYDRFVTLWVWGLQASWELVNEGRSCKINGKDYSLKVNNCLEPCWVRRRR